MRHQITDVDEDQRGGTCSVCGPVRVYRNTPYRGRPYWRCATKSINDVMNRYRQDKDFQRPARFLRLYGITVEDYDRLLAEQSGVCARCENSPGQLRLAVDHDHETGEVRGLLCGPCNTYLGRLEANLFALESDLKYLNGQVIAKRLAEAAPITVW
jgi:hypothetical protein